MKLYKKMIIYPLVLVGLGLNSLGCDSSKQEENVAVKSRLEEALQVKSPDSVHVDSDFEFPDSISYGEVDLGFGSKVLISGYQFQELMTSEFRSRLMNLNNWYNYKGNISLNDYSGLVNQFEKNRTLIEKYLRNRE